MVNVVCYDPIVLSPFIRLSFIFASIGTECHIVVNLYHHLVGMETTCSGIPRDDAACQGLPALPFMKTAVPERGCPTKHRRILRRYSDR